MNTLIEKEFSINQPIDLVWKSLSDPEDIVVCVPGASITEKIDDNNYKGEVVTKFGPIKAKYSGDIGIQELDETNYKMVLKGRGLDSKGKGSADMIMNGDLSEVGGETKVKFTMDITIVGMLAQFGSRLINDVSDQLLNQFVENFKKKLESEAPTVSNESSAPIAPTISASAAPSSDQADAASTESQAEPSAIVEKPKESFESDNSLDASSLIGTVIKSIFGGIIDFIKSLFGAKK